MVAVAYRRWSFTRGSYCKPLTGKILVFWIGGRLREVVAHGGSTLFTTLHFLYLLFDESANWPSRTSGLIYIVVFRPVRCKSPFMLQKGTYYILVGLNCFCHIARIWLFFLIQVFITTKVVSVNESAPEPEVTEEVVTFVQAEKRFFEPQDIQFILDDSQDDLDANVRLVREPVGVVRRKSGNKVKKRRSFREKFKRLSVG